jgi:hypothetical protein
MSDRGILFFNLLIFKKLHSINKKMKSFFHTALALILISLSLNSYSQDYPYDSPNASSSTDTVDTLPKETPSDSRPESLGAKPEPARSLKRFSFRLGGNYSFIQVPSDAGSELTKGFGLEAVLGLGWDFRFYPAFVEFETGYRKHFLGNAEPFHIIPLGFGTYFRTRTGARSFFKYGFKGGLDFRYASYVNTNGSTRLSWGLVPHWGLALQWEFGLFVIEPFVYLNRIQPNMNFISGGLRTGLRF